MTTEVTNSNTIMLTMYNTTMKGISSAGDGGAIYIENVDLNVSMSNILYNTLNNSAGIQTDGSGGAIYSYCDPLSIYSLLTLNCST